MMSGPIAVDTCATGGAGLVTGGFRVSDMFFPPMLSLGSHYHERACFSVVLECSIDEVFPGNTCSCPQSTIIAKPAGERHTDHFLSAGTRTLAIEPDPSQYAESLCSRVGLLDRISHFRD